jgi:hypothetical protein
MNMLSPSSQSRKKKYYSIAAVFILFSLISFLTAFVFSFNSDTIKGKYAPSQESLIGPFEAPEDNTVFQVEVLHYIRDPKWSAVTVELLDENKNFILSFDNEFWYASGGSGEDAWSEGIKDFNTKFTIQKKGRYYLRISSENNLGNSQQAITIILSRKVGSALLPLLMGIFTLLIGLFIYFVGSKRSDQYPPGVDPERKHKQGILFIITTFIILIFLFVFSLIFSFRGWGYTGYYGYHLGSIFFYPDSAYFHYGSPSVRHGSVGGTAHRGGGTSAGK